MTSATALNALADRVEAVFALMDSGRSMAEVMRDDERSAGRRVVVPGDEPWLSRDDWHHSVVVSIDGRRVRLVAIIALEPGKGALRRTVAGIIAAGLKPVIVEPTREMRETMRRWQWRRSTAGHGFRSEERWSPTAALLRAAAAQIGEG